MSLQKYGIEGGLQHWDENGDVSVGRLFGSGAPGGDGDEQDAAAIGTRYSDTAAGGQQYYKDATGGNDATDWVRIADQDDIDALACQSQSAAITTEVTVDEMNVDAYKMGIWDLHLSLDSAPGQVISMQVTGLHNGVIAPGTPADATSVDQSVANKLKLGAAFNHVVTVDINGAGAAQTMRLRVSASAAITASARCRRVEA